MSLIDFTTVIAVDAKYLPLLAQSWQTWRKNRAALFSRPLVILRDHGVKFDELSSFKHPDRRVEPIVLTLGQTQREKVLTAFVKQAPYLVETLWWMKLDVDTVARWDCGDEWADTRAILGAGEPCLVASGWNYTKPANAVALLDEWAKDYAWRTPPMDLPYDAAVGRVITKGRIASYVCWHNTEWSREASLLCGPRLPVPSHDTYLWYVAVRQRRQYRCLKMKKFGWSFINHRRLAETVKGIMEARS